MLFRSAHSLRARYNDDELDYQASRRGSRESRRESIVYAKRESQDEGCRDEFLDKYSKRDSLPRQDSLLLPREDSSAADDSVTSGKMTEIL